MKANEGDLVLIYINKQDGGTSLGRDVEGNPDYLTWVVHMGYITNGIWQGLYTDGTPIGLYISDRSIKDVRVGEGCNILKSYYKEYARKYALNHMEHYLEEYQESPIYPGEKVMVNPLYHKKNLQSKIRSNHAVLRRTDLIYVDANENVARVFSPSINKFAHVTMACVFATNP